MSKPILIALLSSSLYGQHMLPLTGPDGSSLNAYEVSLRRGDSGMPKSERRNVIVFVGDNVIPQFVDGNFWSTAVTLVNLENYRLQAKVFFFDDAGRDLYVPIVGLGRVRGAEITLDAMFSLKFETAGTDPKIAQGWAYILRENMNDCLGGMAVFRQRAPGRPDYEAVVPVVSQFDGRFLLMYDNRGGYATGVALANPSASSVSVPVAIMDDSGKILQIRTRNLGPYSHTAGLVADFFPETAGRRGILEFRASDFGVGALGLRFNPTGPFTSFHVLSKLDWHLTR